MTRPKLTLLPSNSPKVVSAKKLSAPIVRKVTLELINKSEFNFTTLPAILKALRKKLKGTKVRSEYIYGSLLLKDAGFILTSTMIYHKDKIS